MSRRKSRGWRYRHKYRPTVEEFLKNESVADRRKVKFIRRQLINSGGAICAICGKPITDMKDCTVDHIRPRSKGGATTFENCQLAHFSCNLKKGNGFDTV